MADLQLIQQALAQHGHAGSLLERALYAVLASPSASALVQGMGPPLAAIQFVDSGRAALLLTHGWPNDQTRHVRTAVKALAARGLEICVVSDNPADGHALMAAMPMYTRSPVPLYRLDGAGTLHVLGRSRADHAPLHAALRGPLPRPTPQDWDALQLDQAQRQQTWRQHSEQAAAQLKQIRTRPAVATHALLTVLGLVFALQMYVNPTGDGLILQRMGALDAEAVRAGQWWRLVSCTFLHGNFMHVMFNGMVLLALGQSLERLLGVPRFLILYTVSGLLGALFSAWRLHDGGLSVGASGALWGLLGAEAALVYLPQSPWPPAIRQAARQTVMTNLVLNVLVSLAPHVDFAAHAGGGLAGALLVAAGLAGQGQKDHAIPVPANPVWIWAAAGVLCLLYAVGLGLALWHSPLRL